jgi:hypothetical protein
MPPEIQGAPSIAIPATEAGDIVSTSTPQLDEAHRSFAEFHQGYVTGYIEFADTKASWVFTITAGLLAYIFSSNEIRMILFLPGWNVLFLLVAATVLLLVLSAVFSFLVISPRFSRSGEGVVFFGSVAKKESADTFVREIAAMGEPALTEARLKHSYDISRICARKYGHLRVAFWTGILALIGMAGIVLLI